MGGGSFEALFQGLNAASRYLGPDWPLRRFRVFLFVAECGPVTLSEISRRLGIKEGTAYEDLSALGMIGVRRKDGRRLIDQLDPEPGKTAQRFALAGRGEGAVAAIEFAMAAALMPDDHNEENAAFFASIGSTRC